MSSKRNHYIVLALALAIFANAGNSEIPSPQERVETYKKASRTPMTLNRTITWGQLTSS